MAWKRSGVRIPIAPQLSAEPRLSCYPGRRPAPIADYALVRAALGHQRDDSQISLFWLSREGRLPCRCGRWRAEARCATRVAGDVYGKRLRAGSKRETAGKRPGARGNIEGRRRAYLTNAGLRPHGRRCACCGSRNVAVARRTARSCSAEMPRPAACTAGLGDNGFPGRFEVLRMSCNEPRGAGEPVRARAASCATPQP